MRSDRKVIILDNIKSDCIEQAMFILKEVHPKNIDAVKEAERIVENYTKNITIPSIPRCLNGKKCQEQSLRGFCLGVQYF